jgi:hypothetical protein
MHTKRLTRSEFLELGLGLAAIGTVPFVTACPAEPVGECDDDPDVTIGGNHGHRLDVPLDDVADGERATYDIRGSSPHTHSVTLTADDFERLQAGEQVTVMSSVADAHSHAITVRCG